MPGSTCNFSLVDKGQSLEDVSAVPSVATSSTSFDIDKSVRVATQSQPVQVPKQIWESGIWSTTFSDADLTESLNVYGQELRRPLSLAGSVPIETAVESSSKRARAIVGYEQVVRFKPDLTWREQTDAALQSR